LSVEVRTFDIRKPLLDNNYNGLKPVLPTNYNGSVYRKPPPNINYIALQPPLPTAVVPSHSASETDAAFSNQLSVHLSRCQNVALKLHLISR
jgi:hypothetical protein